MIPIKDIEIKGPELKEGGKVEEAKTQQEPGAGFQETPEEKINKPEFHYNIQIHLPDSRDETVYDAIFKSLRRHLL